MGMYLNPGNISFKKAVASEIYVDKTRALYAAREYYSIIREMPAGKGFADLIFLPRPFHGEKPALVVELKWEHSAESAIDQIRRQQYPAALRDYRGALLLVGVAYDKATRVHQCRIERG